MKVGLVIYGGLNNLTGGTVYDRKIVEFLRKKGDEVKLFTLPLRNYVNHLGDNFSKDFIQDLRRSKMDVLLQDELNHPSLFWLNRKLRLKKDYAIISVVHHLRSSEAHSTLENILYRWIEQLYLSGVDGWVFNSQSTRGVVRGLVGFEHPNLVAYPAGDRLKPKITSDDISQRAKSFGPLRIVFLGNLSPRKGLHVLLSALARIPKPDWLLTVIGRNNAQSKYQRVIRQQILRDGLEKQVRFAGVLDTHALGACLEKQQVLVVPSFFEGFGIAYIEGMGFGLPAIGTSAGGPRELITHRENGFLISPGDDLALAHHLHQLHQDRELLLSLSLAARVFFDRHPTWAQSANKIRQFLVKLAKQ